MPDKPDWAVVLRTLYDSERSRFNHDSSESDYSIHPDHRLVGKHSETGLNHESVEDALQFLRDAGMLEIDHDDEEWYLTEKGFSVAHDRVKREEQEEREDYRVQQQNDVNRAIGLLTLGLLMITYMDTLLDFAPEGGIWIFDFATIMLILEGIIVIIIADQLRRYRLLTTD